MILADKIIRLRKRNGWSQEELAEKMNVSRQAVSKWEGAQTVPDLEKILMLGELFGVTTDYLLKDEMEAEAFTEGRSDEGTRRVTLSEANEYIEWRKTMSIKVAFAVFLCIVSVVPMLILGAATEVPAFGISENFAGWVGLGVMFICAAAAVSVFIFCGFQNSRFSFLDREPFETEYGVKGMVREKQKAYRSSFVRSNITGVCFCILSPISLFSGAFTEDDFWVVVMLTVTMLLAGVGIIFFVVSGIRWSGLNKLLKEESPYFRR